MKKNEFIPYEEALAIHELGFYKHVKPTLISFYYRNGELIFTTTPDSFLFEQDEIIPAPLYQQAFRWFREAHNIEACVSCFYNDKLGIPYEKREYHAFIICKGVTSKSKYKTYEEAELACLRKLIEIVELNQNKDEKDINI